MLQYLGSFGGPLLTVNYGALDSSMRACSPLARRTNALLVRLSGLAVLRPSSPGSLQGGVQLTDWRPPSKQVKALLNAAYERASSMLTSHEHELHALASELLERESLTGTEVLPPP